MNGIDFDYPFFMKKNIFILFYLFYFFYSLTTFSQSAQDSALVLTLGKAIDVARKQSPDTLVARHSFRSQYWNYCYFKANYLPSLTFTSTPNFNHSINPITLPNGTSQYVQQNQLMTDANLSLSQNVTLTGGTFSVQSGIQRLDILDDKSYSYKTNAILLTASMMPDLPDELSICSTGGW